EPVYDVARGRLFQLAFKLPKLGNGWRVDAVEVQPKELLRRWVPAGPLLLIDLERPLTPQMGAKVQVKLVANHPSTADGLVLDFPDLEPAERCRRQGTLAISPDSRLHAEVLQASSPFTNPE